MSEEPTEFDKAEFDSIARELKGCLCHHRKEHYRLVNDREHSRHYCHHAVQYPAEKASLVLYSINNFHTWLSIVEDCSPLTSSSLLLRPEWIAISNRLRKLNDTRVSLAHHALGPGKGFEHFVETDNDDLSGIFPTLRPDSSDTRTKSKKHTPIGLEQLSEFMHELATTQRMMATLIDGCCQFI